MHNVYGFSIKICKYLALKEKHYGHVKYIVLSLPIQGIIHILYFKKWKYFYVPNLSL